jgi:class 3 adenylate cyclase/tetratricopeptide (TPR) repeat protein
VRAAVAIQQLISSVEAVETETGRVRLRASATIESGTIEIAHVRGRHRQLLLLGETAFELAVLDKQSKAGRVLLGREAAARCTMPVRPFADGLAFAVGAPRTSSIPAAPSRRAFASAAEWTPPEVRRLVTAGVERAEHRHTAWAFMFLAVEPGTIDHQQRVLQEQFALVDAAAEQHGVCVIGTDLAPRGVKLTLVGGLTGDAEHAPEEMVGFLAHVRSRLGRTMRAGVASGGVFLADIGSATRRDFTLMGDMVNLAARLMQSAEPGDVLLYDQPWVDAIGYETVRLERRAVKGKREPVGVRRLGGPLVNDAPAAAAARPLRGREAERATLEAAVAAALGGTGHVYWIVADAGLGKTHLVRDVVRTRPPALAAIEIRCRVADRRTPFAGVQRIVRALLRTTATEVTALTPAALAVLVERADPTLRRQLPLLVAALRVGEGDELPAVEVADDFRAATTVDALARLITALLPAPTLLFVDDLHNIDNSSLQVVVRIAHATRERALLILAATRPDERLDEVPGARIVLDPFDGDVAGRIVMDASGRALSDHAIRAVTARAAGNPLFLLELTSAVERGEAISDSLAALLESRLDHLDPRDREAVRVAAVIGDPVPRALLERLLRASFVVREGTERIVRERDGSTLVFRHDLLREAAYGGLPFARRRELHRRIGLALEQTTSGRDTAMLALHFERARDARKTWRWARRAAEDAESSAAVPEAARWWQSALAAGRALPNVRPSAVLAVAERLATSASRVGELPLARRALQSADACATTALQRARVACQRGGVEEKAGRYLAATRSYHRGLRLLGDTHARGADEVRADLLLGLGVVRYFQGRADDAIDSARRGLELASRLGDRRLMAQAHLQLEMVLSEVDHPDATMHGLAALALFEELDDQQGLANLTLNLGVTAWKAGDGAETVRLVTRSADHYRRSGDVIGLGGVINNRGDTFADQGRLEDAMTSLREAQRIYEAAEYAMGVGVAISGRSRVHLRQGDIAAAADALAEARAIFERLRARALLLDTVVREVELELYRGQYACAFELCDRAEADAAEQGGLFPYGPTLHRLRGWASVALSERDKGTQWITAGLALARAERAHLETAYCLEALDLLGALPPPSTDDCRAELAALCERVGIVTLPGSPIASSTFDHSPR